MKADQTNLTGTRRIESPRHSRSGDLALAYQEILTVVTRLRANRQAVMDAETFRQSMKAALAAAEADATRKGYTAEDARLATFAVVSFLDESVGTLDDPNFAEWTRKPLLHEFYSEQTSGDLFFDCISRLLGRTDSPEDGDVLEILALCLLLGYRGRYAHRESEVAAIINSVTAKVKRIRGARRLAPDWAPLQDAVLAAPHDPWVRPLVFGALGVLLLAVGFFGGFKFALAAKVAGLRSLARLIAH